MTHSKNRVAKKGGRLPCHRCKIPCLTTFVDSRDFARIAEGHPLYRRALPRAAESRRRAPRTRAVGVPFQPAVPPLGRRDAEAVSRCRDRVPLRAARWRGMHRCSMLRTPWSSRGLAACTTSSVTLDAMTPGEMKAEGNGIVVKFGYSNTPFGKALFAATDRGLFHLGFVDVGGEDDRRSISCEPARRARRSSATTTPHAPSRKARLERSAREGRAAAAEHHRHQLPAPRSGRRSLISVAGTALTTLVLPLLSGARVSCRAVVGGAVGANPHCVAHSVPSRAAKERRARRLSLG